MSLSGLGPTFPIRQSKYRRVKVLLVGWASADLNVWIEIRGLGATFAPKYHYEIICFSIPDRAPLSSLTERVNNFIEQRDDVLHIFYYGGHGGLTPKHTIPFGQRK
jgi:hypothetical protein